MEENTDDIGSQIPKETSQEKTSLCYVKIHRQGSNVVVGACDENCLGLKLNKDKFQFSVSTAFFEGKRVTLEEAITILKNSNNFNAVGSQIIQALMTQNLIHPEGVLEIDGTPIAIKVSF